MEDKIALSPADIPRLFVVAWNNRSAAAIASLFELDADFINVVGIHWTDQAAIEKAHDYGLKVIFKDSALHLGKVKVKQLADDIAVVHARMRLQGQRAVDGRAAGTRQNLFIFVVRRHGDAWLCVSAQNTDIVLGAETHIRDANQHLVPISYRS